MSLDKNLKLYIFYLNKDLKKLADYTENIWRVLNTLQGSSANIRKQLYWSMPLLTTVPGVEEIILLKISKKYDTLYNFAILIENLAKLKVIITQNLRLCEANSNNA